jgi:2-polyprenyl-6-hydroxyphenyl methylase/3-demethylubiquinone-9 3-methyltransferase
MARIEQLGFDVTGVDPSESGVRQAQLAWPKMKIHVGSAYDDLSAQFGQFPLVCSLEVVEHVYSPRDFAHTLFRLAEPGGIIIVTTPYHGYVKNLTLAISGKLDSHFTVLSNHGHIKFWSVKTLRQLLSDAGFIAIRFVFAGRLPLLAKSMVAIAKRPV